MRGTVAKKDLKFDREIEKTARKLLKEAKERKRLARLEQEGVSSSIPTPSGSVHTASPTDSPGSSAPSSPKSKRMAEQDRTEDENKSALPTWTSPRRLARLGNPTNKQVELKASTISLVTQNPFSGLDHEDPYKHLTTFYGIASTLGLKEDEDEVMFTRLFPHSLIGKAKEWYIDQPTDLMKNWNELEKAFEERFFPEDRHLEAKTSITTFIQGSSESLCDAWERYKSLLRNCPKHGFDNKMQIYLFREGLQSDSKIMLDASSGGSVMLKSPEEAVKIINQMALNSRKSVHNRNPSHRKAGILDLDTGDAVLAQNKILTQQLEALQKEMKAIPKLILESIQKEGNVSQVYSCELCFGDHPTGYCPPPEEEVNFVGNQQRPIQQQGQQAGSSNQAPYPSNSNQGRYPNNNYQRGNQYNQQWRTPSNYYYPPPPNYYQQPNNNQQQNPPQNTDEVLKQFIQVSMTNQKNTDASIKNLETQVGQLAQQMAQANQQGGTFTANTQTNPKEHCKS